MKRGWRRGSGGHALGLGWWWAVAIAVAKGAGGLRETGAWLRWVGSALAAVAVVVAMAVAVLGSLWVARMSTTGASWG